MSAGAGAGSGRQRSGPATWALVLLAAACGGESDPAPAAPTSPPTAPSPAEEPAPESAPRTPALTFRGETDDGSPASADDVRAAAGILSARIAAVGIEGCEVESAAATVLVHFDGAEAAKIAAVRDLAATAGDVSLRAVVGPATRAPADPGRPPGDLWLPCEDAASDGMIVEHPETSEPEEGRAERVSARVFTSDDLAACRAFRREGLREWLVGFELRDDRRAAFSRFTREICGRKLAIVLDGRIVSAPVVEDELPGGGVITGGGPSGFTEDEARRFAAVMSHRRLPCRLVPAE